MYPVREDAKRGLLGGQDRHVFEPKTSADVPAKQNPVFTTWQGLARGSLRRSIFRGALQVGLAAHFGTVYICGYVDDYGANFTSPPGQRWAQGSADLRR